MGGALQAPQPACLLSLSVVYDLQYITGGKTLQWCITNKSLEYCHLGDELHEHIAKVLPLRRYIMEKQFLWILFFLGS